MNAPQSHTSALRARQQALLGSLFGPTGASADHATMTVDPVDVWLHQPSQRGLMAYRSNAHAVAQRALAAAYPVVRQLLGDESFDALACALWHARPPSLGDLGRWGDALADFVQGDAQLADVPFLADVARLEWLLHVCETCADRPLEAHSLQRLLAEDPADLSLLLCPGLAWLDSPWPVASIVRCHRDAAPGEAVDLQAVQVLLHQGVGEVALVWREGWAARLRTMDAIEHRFVHGLAQGQSLSQALMAAPGIDIQAWLEQALASGLLRGVGPIDARPPEP